MEYGPAILNNFAAMVSNVGGSGPGGPQQLLERSGSGSPNPGDPSKGPKYTKNNFRKNLEKLTGETPGGDKQAHHVFPQQYIGEFQTIDKTLNIHDPRYGAWWETMIHQQRSAEFAADWRTFLATPNLTKDACQAFASSLAQKYGFPINF